MQLDGAAVRLGDLLREHKPDACALGLGGVEGDEEIRGAGKPWTIVLDGDGNLAEGVGPRNLNTGCAVIC